LIAIVNVSIDYNVEVFIVNMMLMIAYYVVIIKATTTNINNYEPRLIGIVVLYNLFGISLYNYLFYFNGGSLLEFNPVDSAFYHNEALKMATYSINDIINHFDSIRAIDDYGFPLFIALLYKVFASNIVINLVYLIINARTVILLYRIGTNMVSNHLAYISALIYGISSYSIFYQSSGLKETLMVFFIINSFYYYHKFINQGKQKYLLFAIGSASLVVFFRVVVVLFILVSFIINEQLREGKSIKRLYVILLASLASFLFLENYSRHVFKFVRSVDDILTLSAGSESTALSGVSNQFAYMTAIGAGIIGPFPTILPKYGSETISLFSSGLILKMFLSVYFVFSIPLAWSQKNAHAIPLIVFCLFQIFGLTYLLESFEVRKALPHIAILILLSVFAFEELKHGIKRYRYYSRKIMYVFNIGIALSITLWNLLR
jgi:4-amino-4-deoxy-L-arabinose transferase-like glycosyltransferase